MRFERLVYLVMLGSDSEASSFSSWVTAAYVVDIFPIAVGKAAAAQGSRERSHLSFVQSLTELFSPHEHKRARHGSNSVPVDLVSGVVEAGFTHRSRGLQVISSKFDGRKQQDYQSI